MDTERVDEELSPENPEDVAVLYSWARLQGAKYRDFSASRRAYRAQLRHRAAEAQGDQERAAQMQAETAAAETEKAAREAEEMARRHEEAARQAFEARQRGIEAAGEQESAARERAMLEAAELARKASMERIEAARRAEAVAAAEAAARREEREMAEAQASAERQARQYAESEQRRRALAGPQPAGGGQISDPYEMDLAPPRADRIYQQPGVVPEEDMLPGRYRSSRESHRIVLPTGDPRSEVSQGMAAPESVSDAVAAAAAARAAAAEAVPLPPAPFIERRARPRRPVEDVVLPSMVAPVAETVSAVPNVAETVVEAAVVAPPVEMQATPSEPSMTESRARREAHASGITQPLVGRLNSGIRPPQGHLARPVGRPAVPEQVEAPLAAVAPEAPVAEPQRSEHEERRSGSRTEAGGTDPRGAYSRAVDPRGADARKDGGAALPAGYDRREPEHHVPAWIYNQSPEFAVPRPSVTPTVAAVPAAAAPAVVAAPAAAAEAPLPVPAPVAPVEQVVEPSRERVGSRWFALQGVLDPGAPAAAPQVERAKDLRPPVLTVFSLAGGTGKTSLLATLGRALSSTGERVLLTDLTSHGLLPFYFGASELRAGTVRTFSPPEGSTDAPVSMLSYDLHNPDEMQGSAGHEEMQHWFDEEMTARSRGMQRMLVDLGSNLGWAARRLARMNNTVLVPVTPDMNSVISLQGVEKFFAGMTDMEGRGIRPLYVLNQFDEALPLHLDVREVMQQQLGDRLLPFAIRRSPLVAEALAEGMTVMDYDPESAVASDFDNLVTWLKSHAAPAVASFRRARWSER